MTQRARLQRKKADALEHLRSDRLTAESPPASASAIVTLEAVPQSEGQPLDATTRSEMEPRLGHDFSQVRIHADARAAESAAALGALAYTAGDDVVFGAGQYAPATRAGQHLIAHELAHVVQQSYLPIVGPLQARDLGLDQPGDVFEQAADAAADQISTSLDQPTSNTVDTSIQPDMRLLPVAGAAPPAIQRKAADAPPQTAGDDVHGDEELRRRIQERVAQAQARALAGQEPPDLSDLAAEARTADGSPAKNDAQPIAGEVDRGQIAEIAAKAQPGAGPTPTGTPQPAAPVEMAAAPEQLPSQPGAEQSAAPAQQAAVAAAGPAGDPTVGGQVAPGTLQSPSGASAAGSVAASGAPPAASAGAAVAVAEQAAGQADQAFGMAETQSIPEPLAPVVAPQPIDPADATGVPLLGDPEADAALADLAAQAQQLRDGGQQLREQAAELRANAAILRGNIGLIQEGVSQSRQGVQTSLDHLQFRQNILAQAQSALALSEQKATMVAEQAPEYMAKSDEGKQKTGPMATEPGRLAGENASKTSDDPEASAKSREQGQKINQVGSDAATIDGAIMQTRERAGSLSTEAAQATALNTATRGKIDTMQATLGQTDDRLAQMGEQNAQAGAEVESLSGQPGELLASADELDQRGIALIAASAEIEAQLQEIQAGYVESIRSVPGLEPAAEDEAAVLAEEQAPPGEAADLADLTGETAQAPLPAMADGFGELAGIAASESDVDMAALPESAFAADTLADDGAEQETVVTSAPDDASAVEEGRYEDRINLNLAEQTAEALPAWLTGVDKPETELRHEEAKRLAEDRRQQQILEINEMAGKPFEELDAADKMGIALRLTGQNLFGSLSQIPWPGWGKLATGIIDPRTPLMGVVGGLSMMLSGGANLFSGEQWARDPLGNLLKSAADIATGLTIILGSITALAGVIIALMGALTLASLGFAAPFTGPIIAFCSTVLVTVGGWTISVGIVALILQGLSFIKNLIDAATADSAKDLQNQADQMTQDASNAGNVALQMGMAKLAQVGGRQLQARIAKAGGGVGFARGMPGRFASRTRAVGSRIASGARRGWGAVRGFGGRVAGGARTMGSRIAGGARRGWQAVKSLPGRAYRAARILVQGRLRQNSLVIDSNAAIALNKQALGLPLQPGEQAILQRLARMRNVELRVADVTVAEVQTGKVVWKGLPIAFARQSNQYQKVLQVLENFNVGKARGLADRAIVADTFFAAAEPGVVPTFATMDKGIYNNLLRISGVEPASLGRSVPEAFPNGFNVTIDGRTINVIPLPNM